MKICLAGPNGSLPQSSLELISSFFFVWEKIYGAAAVGENSHWTEY